MKRSSIPPFWLSWPAVCGGLLTRGGVRAFAEFLRELELPTEDSELDDALRCHLKQSAPAQNLLVYTA